MSVAELGEGKFEGPFESPSFIKEVWGLFMFGTIVILLRYVARLRIVGWRRLQGDDFMMALVLAAYITYVISITYSYRYGTNLDWSEQKMSNMVPAHLKRIEIGSRLQLFSWYLYSVLIWGLKGATLFPLKRLTLGLNQERLIKWLAIACAVTWVACVITYSAGCTPIERNWKLISKPGEQCSIKLQNLYVTTILSVFTDAATLYIPTPLLWRLRAPKRKKLILAITLGPGVFMITAAIIRIVFTLRREDTLTANIWGLRQAIAGIMACNVPYLRPLLHKAFWVSGFYVNDTPFLRVGYPIPPSPPYPRRGQYSTSIAPSTSTYELQHPHPTKPPIARPIYPSASARGLEEDGSSLDLVRGLTPGHSYVETRCHTITPPGRAHIGSDCALEEGRESTGITVRTSYDVRPESLAMGEMGELGSRGNRVSITTSTKGRSSHEDRS